MNKDDFQKKWEEYLKEVDEAYKLNLQTYKSIQNKDYEIDWKDVKEWKRQHE